MKRTTTKKGKYAAYNVIIRKTIDIGKPFKIFVGKTEKEVKRKTMNYNKKWNLKKKNKGYKIELYKVKKLKR